MDVKNSGGLKKHKQGIRTAICMLVWKVTIKKNTALALVVLVLLEPCANHANIKGNKRQVKK